jgi:hypothetical protein
MQMASLFLHADCDFINATESGAEDIGWIDEGQDYPRPWWELSADDAPQPHARTRMRIRVMTWPKYGLPAGLWGLQPD